MNRMISVRTLFFRHLGRLCTFLFVGLLAVSCREAEPYLQYGAVDLHGWSRDTSYVFTVDSLPGARDYPLSVMLRKSSVEPCPFRSITLVVQQRWTLAVPDSAAQARTDARRHFRAIGQPRPPRCLRDSLLMCAPIPSWPISPLTKGDSAPAAFRYTPTPFRSSRSDCPTAQRDESPCITSCGATKSPASSRWASVCNKWLC